MKKYEFTDETKQLWGRMLHRIRAVADFGDVKAGDLGGWIEKEENLSHEGLAWVWGNAKVCGDAKVWGNAKVCDNAEVWGNGHCLVVGPMGSRKDFTTFFRTKDLKIAVSCGCFCGDIEAFVAQVRQTHGDNGHAKRYLAAVEFAKACIDLSPATAQDEGC